MVHFNSSKPNQIDLNINAGSGLDQPWAISKTRRGAHARRDASLVTSAWSRTTGSEGAKTGMVKARVKLRAIVPRSFEARSTANPRGRPMPAHIARANAKRSATRAAVEHIFVYQKDKMGLFIRTIGPCACQNQDRSCQPRLQHAPAVLARDDRHRRLTNPPRPGSTTRLGIRHPKQPPPR